MWEVGHDGFEAPDLGHNVDEPRDRGELRRAAGWTPRRDGKNSIDGGGVTNTHHENSYSRTSPWANLNLFKCQIQG